MDPLPGHLRVAEIDLTEEDERILDENWDNTEEYRGQALAQEGDDMPELIDD